MQKLKLDDHKFKKGKLITPWNEIFNHHENPWMPNRLPEYLWIGLIIKKYGRKDALQKLSSLLNNIKKTVPVLKTLKISEILSLDAKFQQALYDCILQEVSQETLAPLTLLFTQSTSPIFTQSFFCRKLSISQRLEDISRVVEELMDHQSDLATDVRYIVVLFQVYINKIFLPGEILNELIQYCEFSHDDEEMRKIQPTIGTTEMAISKNGEPDLEFINSFWEKISTMTECSLFAKSYPLEDRDIKNYMENLYDIFSYSKELFVSTHPLDEKMKVLLGIATYSYKRFKEVYDYKLFNAIAGRSSFRSVVEGYIILKYLVHSEAQHPNIWQEYQLYGIGAYKLILSKYRDQGYKETCFDSEYIEMLVNEFQEESFIDIDTRYFNKQNVRSKAESVNEKDLYDFYYDYGSSFEHGLWGAIRETALLKCINPAHQYHCVPDIDDITTYKSILPDFIMIMTKIVVLLDELYGIPKSLREKVVGFEL